MQKHNYNLGVAYGAQGNGEKKAEYFSKVAKLGGEDTQKILRDNNITR